MWACKVASFLFYPEIPNVLGSCWTWPVLLCVYLGFFPSFSLQVLSKGFPCVSWTLLLPAIFFPGPILGGRSCGSPAAPSVSPCPAGRAPSIPSAAVPPGPPPPHLSPLLWSRAVALDLLGVGAGRLRRCPCAGTAWHGRADEPRQLLTAGPGSRGEPPPLALCLGALAGMLEPSEVAMWRGAPGQPTSHPIPNQ